MAASNRADQSTALPREREAKYTLRPSPDESPDATGDAAQISVTLGELLVRQGAAFDDRGTKTHVDTYLDTPSFDLYRRGFSLRLRQHGEQRELGLKEIGTLGSADGTQSRVDFATPLDPSHKLKETKAWPKEMVQALAPLVPKLQALKPVVQLRQTRHKQIVRESVANDVDGDGDGNDTESGADVAEWSLDHVDVHLPPNGDKPSASGLASYDELELELLDAQAEATFKTWTKALKKAPELRPASTSKYARAVEIVLAWRAQPGAPAAPAIPVRELSLAEACRGILCEQLRAILRHEAGVRAGKDPEAVHASRVAIRRARAALHLFGHTLRRKVLRRRQQELKGLGRALGAVRDLDVTLANLDIYRKQLPKAMRPQLKPLRDALRERRKAAHTTLVNRLDSETHRTFIADFTAFCTTPGLGVKPRDDSAPEEIPPVQVRHTMPGIIWRCFEHVRAYETALPSDSTPGDLPPLPTFHALRIEGKYLRYSLEFAADLLGEPGEQLIARLKEFQEHLGALNDAHVERYRLDEWAAELPGKEILTLRAQTLDATMDDLTAATPAKLAQLISHESRTLLGTALANI